ncbi:hypothetical protein [Bacillus sp. 2205SS5-2]|uniref:hypothetical protein n=1 Tax=Bacillus sp. 2205SS5-2 TaxID=3109031 RepID=UPI0030049404
MFHFAPEFALFLGIFSSVFERNQYQNGDKSIYGNPHPVESNKGIALGCYTTPLSNWSITIELERLTHNGNVESVGPDY